MNRAICIIPARGGSKRIPKKNIKRFSGKPIIEYSIIAAKESGLFKEVIVSTDDNEIADIAIRLGASVPFFRSIKNSDDHSTTYDVIEEVLNKVEDNYDYVCCLYPCAPFVDSKKLIESFDKLVKRNLNCVFPIMEFNFPVQRALQCSGDIVSFVNPEYSLARSQDLGKTFHDAGQFYFLRKDQLFLQKKLITSNSGFLIVDEMEGQDIDNFVDWKLAEMKYEILQST